MMENKILRILEGLHSAFLFAMVSPLFYVFFREREDSWFLPLFLLGLLLIAVSLPSRIAARKLRTLWEYLLVCGVAIAGTLLVVWLLGGLFFSGEVRYTLLAVVALGAFWMLLDACRLRIQEKRRTKAEAENDISWQEADILLEKPRPVFLIWFGIVYLAALLNHCPALCNLSLTTGIFYFFLLLVYAHAAASVRLLSDTAVIANVPGRKILRLRRGLLLILLLAALLAVIPSVLTAGSRPYQDLRFRESEAVSGEETPLVPLFLELDVCSGEQYLWMEQLGAVEEKEPPMWLIYLGRVLTGTIFCAAVFLVFRGILGYFLEFRGVPEENGDEAELLEEASAESRLYGGQDRRTWGLSERERIRRAYRRAVRKYRKGLPQCSESPSEIEEKTDFPENFQVEELHNRYEEARYGSDSSPMV